MGACGPERPLRAIGTRLLHPRATYWPHSGPATSQESQVPTPKAPLEKKQRGTGSQPGPRCPPQGVELPSGWGGARHPARKRRQGFPRFKGAIRLSLPSPAGSCARTPAAPAAVRRPGRPPSHSTVPGARPASPGAAARRAGPRRPSAGGGVGAALPAGARRRAALSSPSSPAPAGPAPLPPRAPYAQPARPRAQAPRPHSPPRFAPAPHRLRPAERAGR